VTAHRALVVAVMLVTAAQAGCLLSSDTNDNTSSNWSESGAPELMATLGDPETSGRDEWPGTFDTKPAMHDFDGDGVQEIVGHSNDTDVYVYDARSGEELATLSTRYPPAWHVQRILNSPSAAVMEPGEPPSIVVANHAGYVSVWQFGPEASEDDDFVFHKQWENRMTECSDSPSMDAGPVLADLTSDGTMEILVQTEAEGLFAIEGDGETMWHHCWAGGNSEPVAADLGGDGTMEAIFAADSGFISVFDGASGDTLWTFDAAEHMQPASVTVTPTVAELDGEDPMEILFTARNATHDVEGEYDRNRMGIFAIHGYRSNGTSEIVWLREPTWANPMSYTRLIVEDVDGDGSPEVFGMDWNTIGHRPGNWERLGPAHVFRLNATGGDEWVREIDTWWSNQDISLGDFDGDGDHEVLVNAPVDGNDGLWRLSAADGEAEGFLSIHPWKMLRAPMPSDITGDGTMEIVSTARPADDSLNRGAMLVYDLDVPLAAATPAPPREQPGEG
jgi:WD40 repeat protein